MTEHHDESKDRGNGRHWEGEGPEGGEGRGPPRVATCHRCGSPVPGEHQPATIYVCAACNPSAPVPEPDVDALLLEFKAAHDDMREARAEHTENERRYRASCEDLKRAQARLGKARDAVVALSAPDRTGLERPRGAKP